MTKRHYLTSIALLLSCAAVVGPTVLLQDSGSYAVLTERAAELVIGGCTQSGTDGCGDSGDSCVEKNGGTAACEPNGQDENGFIIFMCGDGTMTRVTRNGDYAKASSGYLCGQNTIIPSGTHYCQTVKACGCKAFPPGGPLACSGTNPVDGSPKETTVPAGGICPAEGCGGIASNPVNTKGIIMAVSSPLGLQ